MHPRTQNPNWLRHTLATATVVGWTFATQAQPTVVSAPAPANLQDIFDAAWMRQPESLALRARRKAAQDQRQAASSWTPEPPTLELSSKTDRLTGNDGAREFEVGVTVPIWLPGERSGSAALADAELAAIESRQNAARLRLAASVRNLWWNWQRTRLDVDIARGQLESARRLAADVGRRMKAGDLAQADQHQADGAVAAAEAILAQADASAVAALQQIKAMTGGSAPGELVTLAQNEPEPPLDATLPHAALAELQDRATVAERAATLAATQLRANPELTVSTTLDRSTFGARYGQAITLSVRIPFGAGPRHDSRVASARADAIETQAQLALERMQLEAERESARARVEAARNQLAAAEHRATLARESRGFFDKSFRLGETDLPTRLRIEIEATEAERQAARSRIELAAAISAWRQALGMLPQ